MAHLTQCLPVILTLRHVERCCYDDEVDEWPWQASKHHVQRLVIWLTTTVFSLSVPVIGERTTLRPVHYWLLRVLLRAHVRYTDCIKHRSDIYLLGLNRLESVKLIQYFCGASDFKHYYDIQCWRFVSNVGTKVAYLNRFFLVARELENHVCIISRA